MADELDLERGDPSRAEERRARRSTRRTASESSEQKSSAALDRELHTRIVDAFGQVVEWREARDDIELATAINEDKDKMAKGLVSLTHTVEPLRQPLNVFLGFVEPIMAFGRVGRILAGRWITRRQAQAEEMAAQQAEWDAAHNQVPVAAVP